VFGNLGCKDGRGRWAGWRRWLRRGRRRRGSGRRRRRRRRRVSHASNDGRRRSRARSVEAEASLLVAVPPEVHDECIPPGEAIEVDTPSALDFDGRGAVIQEDLLPGTPGSDEDLSPEARRTSSSPIVRIQNGVLEEAAHCVSLRRWRRRHCRRGCANLACPAHEKQPRLSRPYDPRGVSYVASVAADAPALALAAMPSLCAVIGAGSVVEVVVLPGLAVHRTSRTGLAALVALGVVRTGQRQQDEKPLSEHIFPLGARPPRAGLAPRRVEKGRSGLDLTSSSFCALPSRVMRSLCGTVIGRSARTRARQSTCTRSWARAPTHKRCGTGGSWARATVVATEDYQ
jgi:hypothetical protein